MVVGLIERLNRSYYHPVVCCYDSLGPLSERLKQQKIEAYFLPRRVGVDLRYIFTLARFLRKQRTDILHLHNPTAFFYGTLAGKLSGTPVIIYTEHGRDFSYSWKIKLANRLLSKMVDRIVTVAEFCRAYLTREEGIDSKKIITIHNGVDAARFSSAHDVGDLRASLGLADDQPVIGIVARLDPIKNHAALITAMSHLAVAVRKNAVLLIIGDGPLREDLQNQVETLHLEENVRFLGARDDVPELLNLVSVFVLCSNSEGLSLTLIEASAAGKPIVATDVGGNSEVVEHGVNGLLVPIDDPSALGYAITEILSDPLHAAQMGEAGRTKFLRAFTLDGMVQHYQATYAACLSTSVKSIDKNSSV